MDSKFVEFGAEYRAFLRPQIMVGIKEMEVRIIKYLGRFGNVIPQKSSPNRNEFRSATAVVDNNKCNQTFLPKNAKTEVRLASTN